jgi:protein-tyrosine phosphatase
LAGVRLLFVCLGNICRSPTAEAVMRKLAADAGLDGALEVESAGTGDWHIGEPPDQRARDAAAARQIAVAGIARRVTLDDFHRFDLIIAMDRSNESDLHALVPSEYRPKISLLRSWDVAAAAAGELDVPDPYWSGPEGFDRVIDVVEAACRGLLSEIEESLL